MKIGLVLPELPQYSETFFNMKIKGLAENGHEVIVFTSEGKETERSGFRVVRALPTSGKGKAGIAVNMATAYAKLLSGSFPEARRFLELERNSGRSKREAMKNLYLNAHIISHRTDVLHFGFATTALKRENAAAATGAKMSVSFRGFDINVYPLKHPGCYSLLWKRLDKVHSISGYLYTKAIGMGLSAGIPHMKITPAVDLRSFPLKDAPGSIHNPVRIFTVGRLNWIKDYETAVSALGILKRKGVRFTYDIAGEGPEMERIRFAVHQAGIEDDVTFHGKLSHEKTSDMMRRSDIYLQTSMQEGFCVSALEAQATGLLCVVSDADGLKENVVDGVTGFFAERRSPRSFAERLISVIGMEEAVRREIAMNARMRLEKDFTYERQKELFNDFFSGLNKAA
ncbi:MAG: glycosyltransferase family 4 protein [Ignavibacteria bacterium]|nr:glycosyltransferase family 4 protein [Ignavibacteria bacterium]